MDNAGPPLSSLGLPGFEKHINIFLLRWIGLSVSVGKWRIIKFLLHQTKADQTHDLGDLWYSNSIVAIGKLRVICNHITDIGNLDDKESRRQKRQKVHVAMITGLVMMMLMFVLKLLLIHISVKSHLPPGHWLAWVCYSPHPLQGHLRFEPEITIDMATELPVINGTSPVNFVLKEVKVRKPGSLLLLFWHQLF